MASRKRGEPVTRRPRVVTFRLDQATWDWIGNGREIVEFNSAHAQLVTDALVMAIWRRGKPDALLHHSDRGSQYTSEQFQRLMADSGVVCSMSRSGNVWDNAAMESFFSSLKTERTSNKTYRTRNEAKADVFDYIERFYNSKRRHSTIGYLSPMEFERQAGFA
jgi:putative transposase